MTYYYFDLKNGVTKRDHNGLELDNDRQAIERGKTLAEEIGRNPEHHFSRVCIVREDGQEVLQVAIIDPVQPLSAPRLKKSS